MDIKKENDNKNSDAFEMKGIEGDSSPFLLFYNNYRNVPELSVFECGWEKCEPNHFYGPAVRKYFILHFIARGSGVFKISGKEYKLGQNQGFIIPAEIETYYEADKESPWHYYWVGFHGVEAISILKTAGLLKDNIFTFEVRNAESIISNFKALCKLSKRTVANSYAMLGYLYIILSELISDNEKRTDTIDKNYISEAIKFMQEKYMQNITVQQVAEHIGLERTYFYKIFKQKMGIAPQQWLINVRLMRAKILIKDTDLSFKEIAFAVGFKDYPNFSRSFKRSFSLSPEEYKKNPAEKE